MCGLAVSGFLIFFFVQMAAAKGESDDMWT
jgi:hypothetical protein